jgi:glycosyltransferase involved in cell wall biosynthesis
MKVIVSCVGKFHAFSLVEQLQRMGVEVIFHTAYSSIKNPLLSHFVSRKDKEVICRESIVTYPFIAIMVKLFRANPQFVNSLFDFWVSRRVAKSTADVFIGWSGMSLRSVNVAKKNGMLTILERGSVHIEIQNELLKNAYNELNINFNISPKTINIELKEYSSVDVISIPSNFCLNSFVDNGFHPNHLFVNTYGVSDFFKPIEKSGSTSLTILYLGKLSIQKGLHLLLNSISELLLNGYDFKFVLVGEMEEEIRSIIPANVLNSANVDFVGHVNHYHLNEIIGTCDVAIVPSVQDGFAMVVPQILKVGLPVIISKNVGAEQIIIEGVNGWALNPDIQEISDRLKWCINNRELVLEMRGNIIRNNCYDIYSWENYGLRYYKYLKSKLYGNEI